MATPQETSARYNWTSNHIPAFNWQPKDQTDEEAFHAVINNVIYATSSWTDLSHPILYSLHIQGSYSLGQLMLTDKLPSTDSWTEGKMVIFLFCVSWLDCSYRIVSFFWLINNRFIIDNRCVERPVMTIPGLRATQRWENNWCSRYSEKGFADPQTSLSPL